MSSINYSLNNKGVRLIPSSEAWVFSKNGKKWLNRNYHFVGKIEISMPNMIVTANDKKKPRYCGDICDLNRTAKSQIVNHFYDDDGKRNKKSVAYFGFAKTNNKERKK